MRSFDVLVVDDDPAVLGATARLIEGFHRVRRASSVAAALAEVARRPPDVVLSDFDMAPATGADLLTALAEQHPPVRRLLYSGADCRALVDAGVAHAAIEKPATREILLAAIAGG